MYDADGEEMKFTKGSNSDPKEEHWPGLHKHRGLCRIYYWNELGEEVRAFDGEMMYEDHKSNFISNPANVDIAKWKVNPNDLDWGRHPRDVTPAIPRDEIKGYHWLENE